MLIRQMPCLAPAAFTIIMGTGAFAIATLEMGSHNPLLHGFAWILNIVNFIIFFFLAIWDALSWPKNRATLRENFEYPDNCALYSATGIVVLVLGAQALRFEFGHIATISIWACGELLTFFQLRNFTALFPPSWC